MKQIEVYYDGNLGDIGNVDWFFASNDVQLKDVDHVDILTTRHGIVVQIRYQQCIDISATIVKNPKQHTNGTPKFTNVDIGMQVWVDMPQGALREPGILVTIMPATVVVDLDNGGSKVQLTDTTVHRLQIGTPPVNQSKPYHVYDSELFNKKTEPKARSEAERMNDFFRGKDTW